MRIALATVGTTGDVVPFRALARRLVTRGHEVTAITWPVHRTSLSMSGVRVEEAGPHADPTRITAVAEAAARLGPMDQVAVLRDFHLADGEAHYRRLRELLPGHDLVLLHTIHALAHAAVLDAGLRWASVALDPVLLPTRTAPPPGMPSLGPANPLAWWLLDRALRRAARPLDDVLARAGSDQRDVPLFRSVSSELHLLACSSAIVAVPPDVPATTHATGAWVPDGSPEPLPAAVETFVDDGAAPVVVTFGSMAPIPRDELAAGVGAILEAGRRVVSQAPTGLRSPNLLETGALDHRALFRRASAVVHHGGAGTTQAACAAGVPSVVVPLVGDQRYWADRLHRLDVAPPALRPTTGVGRSIADAVLATVADPERQSRARALAGRMRSEDGIGTAVELLEAVATG